MAISNGTHAFTGRAQAASTSVVINAPSSSSKFLKPSASVQILGCEFSGGQGKAGVDEGPNRLIEAGLVQQIEELGWKVGFEGHERYEEILSSFAGKDGDIGKMKNPRTVSAIARSVADRVESISKAGNLPLTLGGDHSLGLGTVTGTLRAHPSAGVIWVDAHADINTPLTTDSGNLHGCPISFLMGLPGCDVEPFNSWVQPLLRTDSIVYIGLRDIDVEERRIIREYGIKCFSMHHVDKYGIGKVVEMALDHLNGGAGGDSTRRERPIHLSFDVDGLDPSVAPSTGTPVRGGLTFREGHYICEALHESGCLVAIDIMEVNPSLMEQRDAEATVAVGCSLARSALGETLL